MSRTIYRKEGCNQRTTLSVVRVLNSTVRVSISSKKADFAVVVGGEVSNLSSYVTLSKRYRNCAVVFRYRTGETSAPNVPAPRVISVTVLRSKKSVPAGLSPAILQR